MGIEPTPEDVGNRLRATLDAIDRSEVRHRALLGLVIAGCVGLAIWFDYSLQSSTTPLATVVERGVVLIVAIVALVAVRVQQTMRRNTQMILRAIAELGRKA
jgi:hypothetical protein